MQKIVNLLTFDGQAEEAMNFYVTLFSKSKIIKLDRYSANETGQEGTVKQGMFLLCDQEFMCIDSTVKHDFTFTPSITFRVGCESVDEINRLFEDLSQGGQIFMPLAAYPFSRRFAWIADRFGVSWQLNLL
jgi:predicted 3-demethylubiquinone-9 3-methyltransferase (glyoxalase superfamily)